ncbi:hypothetical protein [Saccharothrix xinjiangensis]|uniref:Uncharacterized protein n=1 Tax=Saccharothrix xinjiangensis TaxID=204798 RepID=A0ABV9Y581_9PSEU
MSDDPEKLVAEALRAQATSSGAHNLLPVPATGVAPTGESTPGDPDTDRTPGTRPTGTAWLLLLATLLGLASGTVVAVMTLR